MRCSIWLPFFLEKHEINVCPVLFTKFGFSKVNSALESSDPGASNGIRSALKSTDPDAFNGGSNFEIRPLEACLVSFEVARMPEKRVRLWQNSKMGQNAYENWTLKAVRNGRRKFRTSAQHPDGLPKRAQGKMWPQSSKKSREFGL